MNCHSAHILASQLDFSAVECCSYLNVEISDRHSDRSRDSIARPGPSNVAKVRHQWSYVSTPEAFELSLHRLVVSVEQLPPVSVSKSGDVFRRADNIGEQDDNQYSVENWQRTGTGEELFDLVEDLSGSAGKWEMIIAQQRDELSSLDTACNVATVLGTDVTVSLSADDGRRQLEWLKVHA